MRKFTVNIENFDGPFDLLYYLIEKNELNIYDIPMDFITREYLTYTATIEQKNMDEMSEFIFVASKLVFIKSKMLLPKVKKEDDEDPRSELVDKLIEYKLFREIAEELKQNFSNEVYTKEPEKAIMKAVEKYEQISLDEVLEDITLNKLYKMFQDVLNRQENKIDKVRHDFKKIERQIYSITEKGQHILNIIYLKEEINFLDIFEVDSPKIEKIITFLAMLELIKNDMIAIRQDSNFDTITISKKSE